jgi:dienelactone hydrolase
MTFFARLSLLVVCAVAAGPAGFDIAALEAARDAARAGQPKRILLHPGNYFLERPLVLDARDSGLTMEAAPGTVATLYGGRRITGWRRDGQQFWSASVPEAASGRWDFRMLSVNGRFADRARLPAAGVFTHLSEFKVKWMSTTDGGWKRKPTAEELTTLVYRPTDLGPGLDANNAEVRVYHMWDESLVRLKSVDEHSHTLHFATPCEHPPGAFDVQKYVVFNVREGLTQPGEWYLDRTHGRLVYWPLSGERMDQAEVIAPTTESIIRIDGTPAAPAAGITLRNLRISVTNTPATAGHFGASAFAGALAIEHASGIHLEDLEIFGVGGQGIKAHAATGLRVERCTVRDAGAGGVFAWDSSAVISDSRVHHIGLSYPSALGISVSGRDTVVSYNEIDDTPYSGITASGAGHRIESNRIHHVMRELHDGAGIYISACHGIVLRGNFVYDIVDTGGYGASSYYLDEQSHDCLVERNVSLNVARPSHNHMAHDNVIRNNVFLAEGDIRIRFPRSRDYVFERNVIRASGKVLFQAPPGGVRAMPDNLIYAGSKSIDWETLDDYGVKERTSLAPRDGTLLEDPRLLPAASGIYRFAPDSAAGRLGIQPLDVSSAGPRPRSGYAHWSWARWREISQETRPEVTSDQTGQAGLADLLQHEGRKITTPEGWEPRRAYIGGLLEAFLGTPPARKPPLAVKVLEETTQDGYTRRKLLYQTEPGEFVPAYLLIPAKLSGRAPAVVCPHQTVQEGMLEPAGLAGNARLHMALALVRRGYVTLTYDAACFGERHDPQSGHYGDAIPFYRKHPHWALMSKMAWDLSRAVDYLETLDFVDPHRIGAIGHSHGGYTTLFAAALDARIRVAVSSCGYDTFRYDGNAYRWSHATALLPRLGFYSTSPYINLKSFVGLPDAETIQIPFDMHELLALIAPRALFLSTSDEDAIFPNGGWSARQSLARLEPLYKLFGAEDRLGSYFFRGGHGFPPDAAERAYLWLDRWL